MARWLVVVVLMGCGPEAGDVVAHVTPAPLYCRAGVPTPGQDPFEVCTPDAGADITKP